MKNCLRTDEWNIIEDGFHPDKLRSSESIFSLGNGRLGQRGNFEETYSNDSLQGSYLAGISFQDHIKVGWWKNGYPLYYSRIPNATNWSGIYVRLIDEELDLAQWDVESFTRKLSMQTGISEREFEVTSPKGHRLKVHVNHINSMADQNLCLIRYSVTSVNYEGKISLVPYLNGDVIHETSNFKEKMWNIIRAETTNDYAYLWSQTKREDSQVCCAMTHQLLKNGKEVNRHPIKIEKEELVGFSAGAEVKPGDKVTLIKYTAILSSLYCDRRQLVEMSIRESKEAKEKGWEALADRHMQAWKEIWEETDVLIEGDPAAQQAIRYNIFQLYQSYRGDDARLNISAKGFTGEKYGGNTYWNTELCCMPFFLLSNSKEIARNLLLYRYKHLPKAIENARKLGFTGGAALFPMATINGEECHNEWEITFEEIHRNSIIVYAIDNYTRYTGRTDYVAKYGLEVMIAVSRFWKQRVSFSTPKQKYVLLGVTGPDEYENNVNNNWYTNYSCIKCLETTLYYLDLVAKNYPEEYARVYHITNLDHAECKEWQKIIDNMYLPESKELNIFVQHDGFLDKEIKTVDEIPANERPINQYWSWDRILRSVYLKQGDVLLGIYLYKRNFDQETISRNFRFYEPLTVHESSLSPFVHSILAARIGETQKAYDLFMRGARIDLDDYNNDVKEGLHITSMAGNWLAIVNGFAGMKLTDEVLTFSPVIPKQWRRYAFKIYFRKHPLKIEVTKEKVMIQNKHDEPITLEIYDKEYTLPGNGEITVNLE